jgi:hypothetical protein
MLKTSFSVPDTTQAALIRVGDDIPPNLRFQTVKKVSKKSKKKLASRWPLPLDPNFERQTARLAVQKKVQKSEKKACQTFRNLITLPKPNQTNGETND